MRAREIHGFVPLPRGGFTFIGAIALLIKNLGCPEGQTDSTIKHEPTAFVNMAFWCCFSPLAANEEGQKEDR